MTTLKFHPTTLLILLLPCFGILSLREIGILWISAALHEAGHMVAYRICGSGFESIHILPFGLCALPKDPQKVSPNSEIFCAAAGPTVNLLICAVLLALPIGPSETVLYLLYCNGALFTINILPILPLDGGRILYFALAQRFDLQICETVCRRSAWILLCLMLYPLCISLFGDKNPSIAMIWGYLVLHNLLRRGSI